MASVLGIEPFAFLRNLEGSPAKVAKAAKVEHAPPPTLASLATLAAPERRIRPQNGEAWSQADWQAYFDERAGIAEFDGGLPRQKAEAQAYECCVSEWLRQYPPPSNDGHRCAHCGEVLAELEALPFLGGNGGHVWMHGRCHTAWFSALKDEAQQGLTEMGVKETDR